MQARRADAGGVDHGVCSRSSAGWEGSVQTLPWVRGKSQQRDCELPFPPVGRHWENDLQTGG